MTLSLTETLITSIYGPKTHQQHENSFNTFNFSNISKLHIFNFGGENKRCMQIFKELFLFHVEGHTD